MSEYTYNWSDLAFGDKKPLRSLNAVLIAAPREMSGVRIKQLIKTYLPTGNIVFGIAEEPYIKGFEGQPQFKTLQEADIQAIADKVNKSETPNKVALLKYKQADLVHILDKIKVKKVVLVNGSWQLSFHLRPEFYKLVSLQIPFEYVSPFSNESEAVEYARKHEKFSNASDNLMSDTEIMKIANDEAANSFANEFQTGAALAKKSGNKYHLILTTYNKVVPFDTFAWHNGALREKHLSAPGDLNHYDTVHAEIDLIIEAQKKQIDLSGTSLFINLLPCPHCAKALCNTDISEIVYSLDHSDGYAVALLEKAGKTVRRLLDNENLIKNGGLSDAS